MDGKNNICAVENLWCHSCFHQASYHLALSYEGKAKNYKWTPMNKQMGTIKPVEDVLAIRSR
jgi:hypothetical protein